MNHKNLTGHLMAAFAMIIWGTSYIASKVLLVHLQPTQLLTLRFFLAYVVSWCLAPKWYPFTSLKEELGFFSLTVTGVVGYFYLENTALVYTTASNVSILLSSAPMFTALAAHVALKEEKMNRSTVIGFLVAMVGVILVVGNGALVLKLNPRGDVIAVFAAMMWAVYSVLLKEPAGRMNQFILTRRMLFYALCLMIPILIVSGQADIPWGELAHPAELFCLAELSVFGSCICYVLWNHAINRIGVVKTNNYIYIGPFITMVTAAVTIREKITLAGVAGAIFIIVGVILAGRRR